MAKKPKKSDSNIALLTAIGSATETFFISKDDALPLLNANPPLIEVNTEMVDSDGKAACRLTEAGQALVASDPGVDGATKLSPYAIITDAMLPPSKRGNKGGGAPIQYPFADLQIGQTFFVAATEKRPDPVKTLGSTVSSANMKYAEPTGETKKVNRAKRGPDKKAIKDAAGNKVMEVVDIPVYKYNRKFVIRPAVKGEKYCGFVAPENGALIGRIL